LACYFNFIFNEPFLSTSPLLTKPAPRLLKARGKNPRWKDSPSPRPARTGVAPVLLFCQMGKKFPCQKPDAANSPIRQYWRCSFWPNLIKGQKIIQIPALVKSVAQPSRQFGTMIACNAIVT
jgi:hypothetical protein